MVYGCHVMKREEDYVGRRAMEMIIQRRRKRGRPKRTGLGMIPKRRDCQRRKCTTVLRGGICHRTSTPHKNWTKIKRKKKGVHRWTLS